MALALVSRAAHPGDRVTHRRALAEGDCADDEVVSIDSEQVHLTGGRVDRDDFAEEWMHFDGTPITP